MCFLAEIGNTFVEYVYTVLYTCNVAMSTLFCNAPRLSTARFVYCRLGPCAQVCTVLHGLTQIWANLGRSAKICKDLRRSARTCADLRRAAQICADLRRSAQI